MKITEPSDRPRELIDQLVGVWECSVRVSHGFLSGADVERIKGYVLQAILGVEHLVVAYDAARPLAFLGANGPMLEMLFVDAGLRGHGIGGALLRHGIDALGVRELTVNEQNPTTFGFYEHLSFTVYQRTARDEAGDPYPLLYLRLA